MLKVKEGFHHDLNANDIDELSVKVIQDSYATFTVTSQQHKSHDRI
jgi:hypothetical protein